jgi:hypothetical protein
MGPEMQCQSLCLRWKHPYWGYDLPGPSPAFPISICGELGRLSLRSGGGGGSICVEVRLLDCGLGTPEFGTGVAGAA